MSYSLGVGEGLLPYMELSPGEGEEIRELRIRIGVIFQKTDYLVKDKGSREMTLVKKRSANPTRGGS